MGIDFKKIASSITGKGLRDDRNIKGIYKIGNIYSNIRNVGLVYKYYGNIVNDMTDFIKFLEFLNTSSEKGNPLRCELIIQNNGIKKTYYICFWYGASLGYNNYQLKDHKEVFRYYNALNNLRRNITNLGLFQNKLEYVDNFQYYPRNEGEKNSMEYVNSALSDLVGGKSEFIFDKKIEILRENLINVLEKKGIDRTNYQFSIGKDLYGKELSFKPNEVEERFYEKMLAFGFYRGDNDFYFPLGVKQIPITTQNELIVDFNIEKLLRIMDNHLEEHKTFNHYLLNITFSPTNSIQIGNNDKYKIESDSVRVFNGISESKNFVYRTTFMLNIFSKENDLSRFFTEVHNQFSDNIELLPIDGLVDANEGFMVQNDYFDGGKFFATKDNIKGYFSMLKQYHSVMKDGVNMGIDFFSKNPFTINILDKVGKGVSDTDKTIQSAPHAIIVGETGSGKTYTMKNYYKQTTAEQLLVLDNKGNFQEIDPEKRGLVLKYGLDIASIIGQMNENILRKEKFLLYKKDKEFFLSYLMEILGNRGITDIDQNTLMIFINQYVDNGKIAKEDLKELNIEEYLINIIVPLFDSIILEAIDEICKTNHLKFKKKDDDIKNGENKVIYNEKYDINIIKHIEEQLRELLLSYYENNLDERFSIEGFKKFVEKLAIENKDTIRKFLSREVDFPNFIGVINENNRSIKESIFYELLLSNTELDSLYKTQIRGVISEFFLKNSFFRYDYFYEFVQSNTNIDPLIKKIVIPLLNALDSRTVSILNRPVSLMEDIFSSGLYQKIIISNEYILQTIKDDGIKSTLTSVLLDAMYLYVELVKSNKIQNLFDYTTIIIDEAHNYLGLPGIIKTILKLIRELRNNRGNIILISQHYNDFKAVDMNDMPFKMFTSVSEFLSYKDTVKDPKTLEKLESLMEGIDEWKKIKNELDNFEQSSDGKKNINNQYKKRILIFVDNKNDPYLLYPKI